MNSATHTDATRAAHVVLDAIRVRGPLSRAAIARATGLGVSTVSVLTRAMVDVGVVAEQGPLQASLGRPGILLAINARHAFLLGVKVDTERLTGVLTDLSAGVLALGAAPLEAPTVDAVLERLVGLRDDLVTRAGIEPPRLVGAGLSLSGIVDSHSGTCINSTVLDWYDAPVGSLAEKALSIPVAVENDANAVTIGEHLHGDAAAYGTFVVLSIGEGIGAGVFVDGDLHRGANGAASELGHCTVELGGPGCKCGKRGCLEAVASVPAILREARNRLDVGSLAEVEDLAGRGDRHAAAVLERAGRAIGLALSHLVNLIDPAVVIVTGSGIDFGPHLRRATESGLAEHAVPLLPNLPAVTFKQESETVWARGAASLAAQRYFEGGRWHVADS